MSIGLPRKGSWKVDRFLDEPGVFTIAAEIEPLILAHVISYQESGPPTEKEKAIAALIASAPDLYIALEMVRDADEDNKRDGGIPQIPMMARARIDAALAKANGGESA